MRAVHGWVLVPLTVLITACGQREEPPTATDLLPEGVDYAFTRLRTFMTREGIRRGRLEAETAQLVGEGELHMRPVKLIFFDAEGRESTEITADYGVYYELTEDMDAEGSVVVLDRAGGQRLETERLKYVNTEDRLYGDTAFTLYRDNGGTVIDGSAFESDPAMDSVIVLTPSGQTDRPVTRAPVVAPASDPTDPVDDTLPPSVPAPPDTTIARPEASDSTGAPPDTLARPGRASRPSPGPRWSGLG